MDENESGLWSPSRRAENGAVVMENSEPWCGVYSDSRCRFWFMGLDSERIHGLMEQRVDVFQG